MGELVLHTRCCPGENITLEDFERMLRGMSAELEALDLVVETGPIYQRFRHPVMDTDETDDEWFFTMTFRDRDQCEKAVQYMYREKGKGIEEHNRLQAMVCDAEFSCWELK